MAQRPRQTRLQFESAFRPTSIDTMAADAMRQLAGLGRTMGQVTEQIGRPIREEQMAEKGREEAEKAFEEGREVKKVSPIKWGSKQYQAASEQRTAELERDAEKIYRSDTAAQSAVILSTFADEYKDDPEGFQQAANDYIQGTVSTIKDPVLAADVNSKLFTSALSYQNRIQSNYEKKQTSEGIIKVGNNIKDLAREANRLAREGSVDAANEILEQIDDAQDTLAGLSPEYKANLSENKRKARNRINENQIVGSLTRMVESDGVSAAFNKLDELSKKVPKDYSPEEWDAFVKSTQQDLRTIKSRNDSAAAAAAKEVEKEAKNYITSVGLGYVVSEEETAAVLESVAGTPLEDSVNQAYELAQYSILSADERAKLRADAAALGLGGIEALTAMEKQEAFINKAVQADAYTFGVRQGIIEEVDFDPLVLADDPDTPEDEFADNMAAFNQRVEQSKILSEQYGFAVSPLSKSEASMLKNALPEMTRGQKIQLSKLFADTPGIFGQIAGEGAGSYAQLAALGNEGVMNIAFDGQDRLAAGQVKAIKLDDFRQDFIEATGNVFGPEDAATTMQAALDYYYGSVDLGSDVYDRGKFLDAIQAVTGGIDTVRGVRTLLPQGVTGDQLEEYFDGLDAEDLTELGLETVISEQMGAGFTPLFPFVTTETEIVNKTLQAVQNGIIKAVPGQGNYIILDPATRQAIPDPADPEAPFVFTITEDDLDAMKARRQREIAAGALDAEELVFLEPGQRQQQRELQEALME